MATTSLLDNEENLNKKLRRSAPLSRCQKAQSQGFALQLHFASLQQYYDVLVRCELFFELSRRASGVHTYFIFRNVEEKFVN